MLILLDLRDVIEHLKKEKEWYRVYKSFPLNDIISTILSIPFFTDYKEALYLQSELRFSKDFTYEEIEKLEIFYDNLIFKVDTAIDSCIYPEINLEDVKFVKWVDNTTILISASKVNNNE
jgi:hypothetical protein